MALQKLILPPEQSGYAVSATKDVITVELGGGFSRSRKDIVNSASIIDCRWTLNLEEYQYFRAFFNIVTKKGTLPFLIDLLLDQPYLEEYEAKFVPDSVRMSDPFGLSRVCTAQLEVIPLDPEEMGEGILLFFGNDLLNQLEQFANYGSQF